MRKLFFTAMLLLTFFVAACGNVKDTRFTATNKEEVIEKVLKSSDLTDEERQLATLAIGRYQGTGESLAGKSVGELIEEQRNIGRD